MFRKIVSFLKIKKESPKQYVAGKNSVVKGGIYKVFKESEISVGDDCLIEGTLTTYTKEARIKIGNRTFVGYGTLIGSAGMIEIGDDVQISFDCLIQDTDTHSLNAEERKGDTVLWMAGKKNWTNIHIKPIRIGDNAWIGAKSIILKGVQIGENAVVGAGSVVTKDVAANTVVAGNPAVFIKNLK